MSAMRIKALCCVCGMLRTCARPRNHRPENYWLRSPVDQDWHRETGTLKCVECNRVTTHALLHPGQDGFRDHAERVQRVALGWTNESLSDDLRQEIVRKYRDGLPRNPYLRHYCFVKDFEAAKAGGAARVVALCGDTMDTPKPKQSKDISNSKMARPVMRDQEYEDPDTGMWWVDMDCPNCAAISNAMVLQDQQKKLFRRLIDLSLTTSDLDYTTVSKLLTVLDEVGSAATAKGSADV